MSERTFHENAFFTNSILGMKIERTFLENIFYKFHIGNPKQQVSLLALLPELLPDPAASEVLRFPGVGKGARVALRAPLPPTVDPPPVPARGTGGVVALAIAHPCRSP